MTSPLRLLLPALISLVALAAPPRLEVEPKGRVLLGSVGPREVKTLAYTFTNTSGAPIALRLADLSPGVKAWGPALEGAFQPGQSLGLTLTVDPAEFVGPQVRSIRLVTDDPGQGEYRLPLAMDVRADLTVDAVRGTFGDIGPNQSPQVTFRFTRETGVPTVLRLVRELPPYLEAELLAEGAVTRLQLTFRQALAPAGATRGLETLEVASNAPLQPHFVLFVAWALRHPIEALPSRIVMLEPKVTRQELRLRARDGKPFRLARAQVDGDGFSLGALPVEAGPEQLLTVLRTAPNATRAVLTLWVVGLEEPLKVPIAFLPPPNPSR
jgi:hypothetical protein